MACGEIYPILSPGSFHPERQVGFDGRLGAASQRLNALMGAVNTVRPAVRDFYASLTDEQKAALSIQPALQNRG